MGCFDMAATLRTQLGPAAQDSAEAGAGRAAPEPAVVAALLPYLDAMRHGLLLVDERGRVVL
ncbi:hypothetical protein ACFPYM_20450, partial [Methylobacterium hispanicum]